MNILHGKWQYLLLFGLRTFQAEAKITVQEIQNTFEGIKN